MTLSLGTAYRSFGGEVEASSTPKICRLPDSRRHQLWAIALRGHRRCCGNSAVASIQSGKNGGLKGDAVVTATIVSASRDKSGFHDAPVLPLHLARCCVLLRGLGCHEVLVLYVSHDADDCCWQFLDG